MILGLRSVSPTPPSPLDDFFNAIRFLDRMQSCELDNVAVRLSCVKGWPLSRARKATRHAWREARHTTFYYVPIKVVERHGLEVWLARESPRSRRIWIAGASFRGVVLVWFNPWGQRLKKDAALRKFAAICKHFGLRSR